MNYKYLFNDPITYHQLEGGVLYRRFKKLFNKRKQ